MTIEQRKEGIRELAKGLDRKAIEEMIAFFEEKFWDVTVTDLSTPKIPKSDV